jgi:hypothetical protein
VAADKQMARMRDGSPAVEGAALCRECIAFQAAPLKKFKIPSNTNAKKRFPFGVKTCI